MATHVGLVAHAKTISSGAAAASSAFVAGLSTASIVIGIVASGCTIILFVGGLVAGNRRRIRSAYRRGRRSRNNEVKLLWTHIDTLSQPPSPHPHPALPALPPRPNTHDDDDEDDEDEP